MICELCKKTYIGETARNAKSRSMEYQHLWKKKDNDSVLHRHWKKDHNDLDSEKSSFRMKVTSMYKSALDKQISESVKIKNFDSSFLINQRSEWQNHKQTSLNITSI